MMDTGKSSNNNNYGQSDFESRKITLRVNIPDIKQERILEISSVDLLWDAKLRILQNGDVRLREPLNYGFFMNPKNGKSGKFLDEWRPAHHYSFETPLHVVSFVKKRRLYKNTGLSEMKVKRLRSKSNTCEFMKLIREHNLEEIIHFLNKGFDPNCHDPDSGETPLTLSVKYSNCDQLVTELYRGGAHVDYRNKGSFTALHEAVKCHNINAVKSLLNLGMSAKVRDVDNLTPLYHGVALNCSIDILSLLLYDHSPVGCVNPESGLSELHLACIHCPSHVVDLLLFYGADFNLKSRNGETSLHICARLNKADSAYCLLTRGINPNILNSNGKRAEEVAAICRNKETASVIHKFDRCEINPHNQVPTRNERRRSNLCEPRVSLSQNDLFRQSRLSSVSSAFSSLISRMKNKKPKVVGSLLPSNQFLTNMRSTFDMKLTARPSTVRTLYIVRNKEPFGFVLRGPKKRKTREELTAMGDSLPSYHFIESVAKNSVADKVGLMVNDFILEIDNIDVRCLSHTEVVTIIRRCGSEITVKVGTYVSQQKTDDFARISAVERNDASLLQKRKLTVNSLNIASHSTGASLRATSGNDIEQITRLFMDENDSEEVEKQSEDWNRSDPAIDDVILPPPDEFCDLTICPPPPSQYSPIKVPNITKNLEDKFMMDGKSKQRPPSPPMPPARTTSIKSISKALGYDKKEPRTSNSSVSHMEELRAALQKRANQGRSIVDKIENKQESYLNFGEKLSGRDLLEKYCSSSRAETKSSLSSQMGLNSFLSRPGTDAKSKLGQYDSGIEVVHSGKTTGDDPCSWLLNLQSNKGDKSTKSKNYVGKQTIF